MQSTTSSHRQYNTGCACSRRTNATSGDNKYTAGEAKQWNLNNHKQDNASDCKHHITSKYEQYNHNYPSGKSYEDNGHGSKQHGYS